MPRRVSPSRNPAQDVRATIRSLLQAAADQLDQVVASPSEIGDDTAVHDVRKRGKEARALARLLGRTDGRRARRFDAAVRDAGRAVSSLRDAQTVAGTLDALSESTSGRARTAVRRVLTAERRAARPAPGAEADAAVASEHLTTALRELERWRPGTGFDPLADGIERAYRSARGALEAFRAAPDDEHMHEWRKTVKRLWYQTRAMRDLAPSALEPMVEVLDQLSDLLGADHDLAVLVERLATTPDLYGGERAVTTTIEAARARQVDLRERSIRLGATLFAERSGAFRRRIESYWSLANELGPEPIRPG
jgi:CHAD domain-containing protein